MVEFHQLTFDEKTYYNDGKVTVTKNLFTVAGKSYAIEEISDVKNAKVPNYKLPGILIVLALAVFNIHLVSGLVILGIAVVSFSFQLTDHSVCIRVRSEDIYPVSSGDNGYIQEIVDAVEEAMMANKKS